MERGKRFSPKPLNTVIFDPVTSSLPLVWADLFGRGGRVELEVGCGKGRYLLNQAADHPEVNYVGLEYARAYLETIAERAGRRGLGNVRAARCEAGEFFREAVPPSSLSAFYLLYPDPWPKKRHHKRRLVQDEFLADLRRALQPGAKIEIATDHAGYFDWMVERFARWKGTFVLEQRVVSEPARLDVSEGRTNYECKYIAEGRTLHFLSGYRTGF